ncbi:MAG: ATP-binding protein [Gemmatimonadales bacterium]
MDTNREQVQLAPGRVVLDLDRLAAGDVLGSEITQPLEVAAFLDGFEIPDATEFMMWKDRQQARLLPIIKDALVVLIDRCRRTGDTRQIEDLADKMLALDDLSEEAVRAKMEARAFAGDRLTALKTFEAWKDKLAREIDAVPSTLIDGMAVRLRRRGWERTTRTEIPPVPTDQWRNRPFVGRASEYRAIYEAWEGMRKGISSHALIVGDSGIGKTTLVERFTTAAGLEGAAISRVQCYDLEREVPYATLAGLINGLLHQPGVSATPPDALAEIARTVPDVRRRFSNIPGPEASLGETARLRLTESFHQMLLAIAEEHPVILVVDDLHLADDASLAVLHLVMRRAAQEEIMMMFTARLGELPSSPQAARLRERGAAIALSEIELLPLTNYESHELLDSILSCHQTQPAATARRDIVRAAGGYPMVLELLVQDWQANGDQSLALAVDTMTAELGTGGLPPAIYRQVLDRIIRALDHSTRNVLNLATILGSRLNELSMYALADVSTGQTMTGMAELVSRRVLRDGGQGLEFVNELVRTAAYLGVPSPLRKAIHGNVADRLIGENERGAEALGLEIAWHCTRAGRLAEATPFLLGGARDALRKGAPHSAEAALSSALPNLVGGDSDTALILLAESLQEQSRWQESLDTLSKVDTAGNRRLAELVYVFSVSARRRLECFDHSKLAPTPARLLEFIRTPGDGASRTRAAVEAASILNTMHCRDLAPELLDAISALEASDIEADDRAHLLLAKAMLLYNSRHFDESADEIRRALSAVEKNATANSVAARLYSGLGAIHSAKGNYSEAIPWLLQAYRTSVRIGSDPIFQQAAGNLALAYARTGNYEGACEWAENANSTFANTAEPRLTAGPQAALLAHAMLGRSTKADEVIAQRHLSLANLRSAGISQAWDLYTADAYLLLGRYNDANQAAQNAIQGVERTLHMDFCVGPYARWLARTSLLSGSSTLVAETSRVLHGLLEHLEDFDAIDQVEILNAKEWLEGRLGTASQTEESAMAKRLTALPEAIRDQLARMGMLSVLTPYEFSTTPKKAN